ncbi:hypothetical protein [Salinispora arenicola]|uniref:hypothetical protein n=1 Tax=Salinispora arenicola TaxID=168697 RepID=UPI00039D258E|nr:hypothetical protein [Salinispora arenicola]
MNPLRTEADLLRTLERGCYTLPELYRLAEQAGLADRADGRRIIQDGQAQYKRRLRSALHAFKRQGRARPAGTGKAAWLIEGSTTRPHRALLIWLPADPSHVELVLGAAATVLREADEPIDLIVADPPWALGRGDHRSAYRRTYGRNHDQVMPGYVDVDPAEYAAFTSEWIGAASAALRPGGYLAVVTGAQQAARVQVTAEDAGLTYVTRSPSRADSVSTPGAASSTNTIGTEPCGPASRRTWNRPMSSASRTGPANRSACAAPKPPSGSTRKRP